MRADAHGGGQAWSDAGPSFVFSEDHADASEPLEMAEVRQALLHAQHEHQAVQMATSQLHQQVRTRSIPHPTPASPALLLSCPGLVLVFVPVLLLSCLLSCSCSYI